MSPKFFLLFLIHCVVYLGGSNSFAQSTNTEGVVVYNYHTYGGKTYESYLYFKDGKYHYTRHQEPEEVEGEQTITYYYYKEYWDSYYLVDEDSILETFEGKYATTIFAKSQKNEIEWEVTSETQKIGGFMAQKAITKSLYRDFNNGYIDVKYGDMAAWFVPEIPIPLGPEGYGGLPGLIVKLEYEGGNVGQKPISFNKISYEAIEDWEVPSIDNKVRVTKEALHNRGLINKKWLKRQAKKLKSNK